MMKAHEGDIRSLHKTMNTMRSGSLDRHLSSPGGYPTLEEDIAVGESPTPGAAQSQVHRGDLKEESPTRRARALMLEGYNRQSRPRRKFEDEHYVHSISQSTGVLKQNRLRGRRQSDPGTRVSSLSPLRYRVKVDREISEDSSEDELVKLHPRLAALRSSSEVDVPEDIALCECLAEEMSAEGGVRARTPANMAQWRRTHRSHSLPVSDRSILEMGEALGAVAIQTPAGVHPHPHPPHHHAMDLLKLPSALSPSSGVPIHRRRSVSIENPSLESISEENAIPRCQQTRRFSTPVVNIGDMQK